MTMAVPPVFRLNRGPLFWPVFAFGLVVFALSRWLPGVQPGPGAEEARFLDQAFVRVLQERPGTYGILEDVPQTFGARVLPRYLLALVSVATGDTARAGLWLSLAGLVAAMAGMYSLCLSLFPFRPFALASVGAFAGLGAVQMAFSPDPSIALGMALVVWGVVSFFSSLENVRPERIFLSGFLIGLAGYIHIELSLMWILLALYLLSLGMHNSPARARGMPLAGMAFGGVFMVLAVLWPMIDRNLMLAHSPILPGYDAERLLGAPPAADAAGAGVDWVRRFLNGFFMLARDAGALGIFAGLLWPLGIVLCTVLNRHKALPYFWVPFIILWVMILTGMSPVTGVNSFETCLRITTPLLMPFAILVLVYPLFYWFQRHEAPPGRLALGAAGLTVVAFGVVVLPRLAGGGHAEVPEWTERMNRVIGLFESRPELRNEPLLTDRPGMFLGHGKQRVHGLNGETDWSIMLAKTADGSIQPEVMLSYIQQHGIRTIHLARHDDPLISRLERVPGFPGGELLPVPPPHRVFELRDF